ncbi:MAG: dependent oxidoreductase, partial [Caulobacteraceae bacterium]|nr:dependent oxidoreductase [Caulobacteraceae bacterium]
TVRFTCGFLFMCAGYYDYEAGYTPEFEGVDAFEGVLVHPQKWPKDLDYAGKRVVVIGSGATAVTIVPEMAKTAGHVTMLQRSPTYMVSRPGTDAMAEWLKRRLPLRAAYWLTRWKNVLLTMYFFRLARGKPQQTKARLIEMARRQLPAGYDVETHFTPRYNPWDQRLCLVPDNDFFDAVSAGTASVVTDEIEAFTARGLKLKSGRELEADIVITATGLSLNVLGGMQVAIDGRAIDFGRTLTFKGMMYRDVPNLASTFGYTNASWTLKADLTCEYVCRLLNHLDRVGMAQATPRLTDPDIEEVPWLDFSSGYVQRAIAKLPKQGSKAPWKLHQNYALDILNLRYSPLENEQLEFSNPKGDAKAAPPSAKRESEAA